MLRNYLKIAFRNLWRRPGYAAINVGGLALGMACCLMIGLFLRQQVRYDRFHEKADRIYRVALDAAFQGQEMQSAMTAWPLGETLVRTFPEVERATRLWQDRSGRMTVYAGDQIFAEDRVFFADSTVFDVFTFPLLRGDPAAALARPFSLVLTESAARKYFGEADPMGQTLRLREPSDRDLFDYTVTGVMADLPAASHVQFDVLASYVTQRGSRSQSWLGFGLHTYILLGEEADAAAFEAKLPGLMETHLAPQVQENFGITYEAFRAAGNNYRLFLQPLPAIFLHSNLEDEIGPTGDVTLVYLFAAVALFILLLACINFINLATANALTRAREVGVRKALGSQRSQLVAQFLMEAVLLSGLALGLAVALVQLLAPAFEALAGQPLSLTKGDAGVLAPLLLGAALLIGLAAGAYPAFFLSRFRPAKVLKGALQGGGHRSLLRDGLVVFQFTVSIALLAGTLVVARQMDFILNKDLGFETEQVVVLEGAEVMGPQAEAFREALRALPGVVRVTNAEKVPGRTFNGSRFRMEGAPDDATVVLEYTYASFDFIETLGLRLKEGRSLSRARPGDSLAVLLNEAAVTRLGLEDPVGQRLVWSGESVYTIVGVVEDFHIASLHRQIGPVALLGPDPRNTNRPNLLVVARLRADDLPGTLARLESLWEGFAPQQPFTYSFLDQDFAALYRSEQATGCLFGAFAALAVLIACCGLFGLAAFTAERRTKEIGVRKVFGATAAQIVALLSKDFLKLVVISFVLAVPAAYFVMRSWLDDFAYRTEIGAGVFLVAGVAALGIAFLTISYRAVKTARMNPTETLRYE